MPTLSQIEDVVRRGGAQNRQAARNVISGEAARDWMNEQAAPGRWHRSNSYARPKDLLRDMFGPAYEERGHVDVLDRALVRLTRREIHGLVVNLHSQVGKSKFCSVAFPAWYLGQHPSHPIILTSYGSEHARDLSRECRELVHTRGPELGLSLLGGKQEQGFWGLEQGGGVWAGGLNAGVTGKPAKLLICDDPIKNWAQATSPTYKQLLGNNWKTACESRLREDGVRLIVMTRWTPDDLTGWVKKHDPDTYEIINIPALCLDPKTDPIGRRRAGDPLPPATRKEYERKRSVVGTHVFDALWQGRPHRHPPEHEELISYAMCAAAAERRVDLHVNSRGEEVVAPVWRSTPEDGGCDVARSPHGDRLTWATVRRTKLTSLEVKKGQSTMKTANALRRLIVERKLRSLRVDDTGVGGGVTDRLIQMQQDDSAEREVAFLECEIIGVNFAQKAWDQQKYVNIRTEMWMIVVDDLREGRADLPWDDELFDDLIAPRRMLTGTGKEQLESSESLRRRGVRSPDLAWAYALARYPHDKFARMQAW